MEEVSFFVTIPVVSVWGQRIEFVRWDIDGSWFVGMDLLSDYLIGTASSLIGCTLFLI